MRAVYARFEDGVHSLRTPFKLLGILMNWRCLFKKLRFQLSQRQAHFLPFLLQRQKLRLSLRLVGCCLSRQLPL